MGCRIPKKTKTGTIAFSRDAENSSTHEFFGYTMEVAPVTDKPGTYRVVFGRLSETAEDLGLKDPAIWAMLPAPSFPAPQIVTVSDSLLFDVFVNPATGQKIVDYIHIRQDACDPRTASDLPCLKRSLEDARHALNEKVKLFENSPDTAKAVSARSSQQTWEKYLTDACSPLDSEFKRLRCELKLVQSRTQDLATIY
jgi:hypothetical protein